MKKVILINIGLLVFFLFSCYLYNHRKAIINSNHAITNYSILERYRHRYHGSLLIEFNGKQYYVGVSRKQAFSQNPQDIRLFYDKDRDDVFEKDFNDKSVKGLVVLFGIFLCSVAWLGVIIWKRHRALEKNQQKRMKAIENAYLMFEEAAAKQVEATEIHDYKRAKKYRKMLDKSACLLRETDNLKMLSKLLDCKSVGVRLWSATYLLPVSESDAMQVLQQIANEKNAHSVVAKKTIDEWDKQLM